MKPITWAAVLRAMVVVMCLVGLSVPASRVEADEPGEALFIHLQAGSFDPLTASPSILPELSYDAVESEQAGTYLLQFSGPVLDEWKAAVEAAGGQIGPYIPDYAFLVYLDATAKAAVSPLPFVRWVGPYQPAYKLAPWVDFSERSYRVILAPWANKQQAGLGLSALASSLTEQADGYSAVLDGQGIRGAALRPEVLWIEPIYLQELHNDIGGGTIMGGATAYSRGYDGAGIEVAVTDTGLDTGVADDIHSDFAGRIGNISSWPVQSTDWGCGVPLNVGADDGAADLNGHGTHVAGSVAGDGTLSSGVIKGLAPEATINFQAVEQLTDWPAECGSGADGRYLTGIPDDVRLLLNEVYGWGARIQNNSWGGGSPGEYDQQSAYFDDFIHSHPDMTVVVSAGNDGTDANDDGYVDLASISSPGTAKNVITIGASDNERATGGYSSYTWGGAWPSDYSVAPTSTDRISDSRNELAAFSSRGPMDDGRIKPDLVAPGTDILSTKSSQTADVGWGAYNTYYTYMGGTSMASPLSAGAATVVRDFLMSNGIANPSAALIKATLINSAVDIAGYGNTSQEAGLPIPNMHEGWGRIDVAEATKPLVRRFVNNTTGLSTIGTATYSYLINSGAPFKVSLVWSDPEAAGFAGTALVNNLNLTVTAPGGAVVYKGNVFANGWSTTGGSADTVNNVENVYVQSPTAGTWTVTVTGANVSQGPQPFALVVNANFVPIDYDYATYLPLIMRGVNLGVPTLNDIDPNLSSGTYLVYWAPNGDAPTGYDIEENGVIKVTNHASTSYNVTGKAVGTYTYRVRARHNTILGPWSTSKSVTVISASASVVVNPGFESGQGVGWTESSSQGWDVVMQASSTPVSAHGGSWIAWLGGDDNETGVISQSLTIQPGTSVLSYWYWVGSDDTCGFDFLRVKIGATTVYTHNLCSTNATGGWVKKKIALNTYAGQSVTLRFEVTTNSSLNSNLFLDDVSFVATFTDIASTSSELSVEVDVAVSRER